MFWCVVLEFDWLFGCCVLWYGLVCCVEEGVEYYCGEVLYDGFVDVEGWFVECVFYLC